jgi:hypothetical protein
MAYLITVSMSRNISYGIACFGVCKPKCFDNLIRVYVKLKSKQSISSEVSHRKVICTWHQIHIWLNCAMHFSIGTLLLFRCEIIYLYFWNIDMDFVAPLSHTTGTCSDPITRSTGCPKEVLTFWLTKSHMHFSLLIDESNMSMMVISLCIEEHPGIRHSVMPTIKLMFINTILLSFKEWVYFRNILYISVVETITLLYPLYAYHCSYCRLFLE